MADRLSEMKKLRRLHIILIVACIVAGAVLIISLTPFFVRQHSLAGLMQGKEHYFVYDDQKGQQYVISAQVKKDRTVKAGQIEYPVVEYKEVSLSDPLEEAHPEAAQNLNDAMSALKEKALAYETEYPGNRIVNCTIKSFTQEGITVSFYGIGIRENGSYEEIDDTVTQPFLL